jgi:hypothetical protein
MRKKNVTNVIKKRLNIIIKNSKITPEYPLKNKKIAEKETLNLSDNALITIP